MREPTRGGGRLVDVGGRRTLCVDDARSIDWGDLEGVEALCLPAASRDGHLAVICRIKGWPLLDHAAGATVEEAPASPGVVPAPPGALQVSVFDADDVRATGSDAVREYFVRWEHLLYRTRGRTPVASASDLLRATVPHVLELAGAASGKTVFLRLPDVRSDDPTLAGLFFDGREPNPALGVHGTRHLVADGALRETVRAVAADLPANVRLAASFVTSSVSFFRLQDLMPEVPLSPFVETPMFLVDHLDYRGLDQVLIGLKDLTYLLRGLDRENARIERPPRLYTATVAHLRLALAALTDGEGPDVSMSCTLEQLAEFSSLLDGVEWVPSLPAAQARVLLGGSHPAAGGRW